jgi:RNA polymerase sigma-70 factor (ECF subfamily)
MRSACSTACQRVKPDLAGKGQEGRCLTTTRWSVILSCVDSAHADEARNALGELCRIYWRPIFAYVCRSGRSTADAQDLTQDFLLNVMQGNLLKLADPARGRFRSLLFKALQNFLITAHEKQHARKRGGHIQFIAWEEWMADAPSHLCVPAKNLEKWSVEKVFDYRWAATVAEQALRRLGDECEAAGRRHVFEVISPYLTADRADVSYADLAQRLDAPVDAIRRLLHRMRERYRRLLREEVGQTVSDPTEVDDELRYLCAALASAK